MTLQAPVLSALHALFATAVNATGFVIFIGIFGSTSNNIG